MKMIIDIPEEDYERCKKRFRMRIDIMGDAIAKGTPLSSHGNLVDIDKLYDTVFNPRNGILEIYKDHPRELLENELESVFDKAETIIESDKEANDG